MTTAQLISRVTADPNIRNLRRHRLIDGKLVEEDYPIADLQAAVNAAVPEVVAECAHEDFDFTCDVTDVTGGSIIGTATYKLEGKNQTARDIINVRYGSTLLKPMTDVQLDELFPDRSLLTTVKYWTRAARDNGFPVIELAGTPTTAGETIRYRYRRKRLLVEEWPEGWEGVLVDNLVKKFVPDYGPIAERSFAAMVMNYRGSNASPSQASQDPTTRQMFQHLNSLHGY